MKLGDLLRFLIQSSKFHEEIYFTNPNFDPQKKTLWIVGIHGTFHTPKGAFSAIIDYLKKNEQLPPHIVGIFCPAFSHRFRGIAIEKLAHQLQNQLLEKKISDCILIGHSRGSLIAAYFKEFLAHLSPIKIEKTIALGGPFQGASLAQWFPSFYKSIAQMKAKSDFLKKLAKKTQEHPQDYFCIAGENDFFVSKISAIIPNAFAKTFPTDHLGLLTDPTVLQELKNQINQINL